jgi:hypothetical protein
MTYISYFEHMNVYVTLYLQKSALTSPASGGRLVGIVCSLTQATEFSLVFYEFLCSRTDRNIFWRRWAFYKFSYFYYMLMQYHK